MAPGSGDERSPSKVCKQCKITKEKIERKEQLILLLKAYVQAFQQHSHTKVQLAPHQVSNLRTKAFEDSVKLKKELSELVTTTKFNLQIQTKLEKQVGELRLAVDDKDAKLALAEFELKQLAANVKEKNHKIKFLEDKVKRLSSKSDTCVCSGHSAPKKKRKSKDRSLDECSSVASVSECPPSVASTTTEFPHAGPSSGPGFILTPASSTTSCRVQENINSPGISWDSVSGVGSPVQENSDADLQPSASSQPAKTIENDPQDKVFDIFESPDKTPPPEDSYNLGNSVVKEILEISSAPNYADNGLETAEDSRDDAETSELTTANQEPLKTPITTPPKYDSLTVSKDKTLFPEMPSIFDIPSDGDQDPVCHRELELSKSVSLGGDWSGDDVALSNGESDIEDPSNIALKSLKRTEEADLTPEHKSEKKSMTGVMEAITIISPSQNGSVLESSPKKVIPLATFLKSINNQCQPVQQEHLELDEGSLLKPLDLSSNSDSDSSAIKTASLSIPEPISAQVPSVPIFGLETSPTISNSLSDPEVDERSLSKTVNFSSNGDSHHSFTISDVPGVPPKPETPPLPNFTNKSDERSNESHVFPSPDLRALLNSNGVEPLVSPIKSLRSSPVKTPTRKTASTRSPRKAKQSSGSPSSQNSKSPQNVPRKTPTKMSNREVVRAEESPYKALGLDLSDDSDEQEVPPVCLKKKLTRKCKKTPSSPVGSQTHRDTIPHAVISPKRTSPFQAKLDAICKERAVLNGNASDSFQDAHAPKDEFVTAPNVRVCRNSVPERPSVEDHDESVSNIDYSPIDQSSSCLSGHRPENGKKKVSDTSTIPPEESSTKSVVFVPGCSGSEVSSLSTDRFREIAQWDGIQSQRKQTCDELKLNVPAESPPFLGFESDDDCSSEPKEFIQEVKTNPTSSEIIPQSEVQSLKSTPECGGETLSPEPIHQGKRTSSNTNPFSTEIIAQRRVLPPEQENSQTRSVPAPFHRAEFSFTSSTVTPLSSSFPVQGGALFHSAFTNPYTNSGSESLRLSVPSVFPNVAPFESVDCPTFSDLKVSEKQPGWEPFALMCYLLEKLSLSSSSTDCEQDPKSASFFGYRDPGKRAQTGHRSSPKTILPETVKIKQEPLSFSSLCSNAPTITDVIDLRCQIDCQDELCCRRKSNRHVNNRYTPTSSSMFSRTHTRNSYLFKTESSSVSVFYDGPNYSSQSSNNALLPTTMSRDSKSGQERKTHNHSSPTTASDSSWPSRSNVARFEERPAKRAACTNGTNTSSIPSIKGARLTTPLPMPVISGQTTLQSGLKVQSTSQLGKSLKLASPKFKNKTPPRSPKKTANFERIVASSPLTQPAGVRLPALQADFKGNNASGSVTNILKADLPKPEKKPIKFHRNMNSAMALLKKKFAKSPKKRPICIARKSCNDCSLDEERMSNSLSDGRVPGDIGSNHGSVQFHLGQTSPETLAPLVGAQKSLCTDKTDVGKVASNLQRKTDTIEIRSAANATLQELIPPVQMGEPLAQSSTGNTLETPTDALLYVSKTSSVDEPSESKTCKEHNISETEIHLATESGSAVVMSAVEDLEVLPISAVSVSKHELLTSESGSSNIVADVVCSSDTNCTESTSSTISNVSIEVTPVLPSSSKDCEDWMPQLPVKKKRIAHSTLKVIASPSKTSKIEQSLVKPTEDRKSAKPAVAESPEKSYVSPSKTLFKECEGSASEFKLPRIPVSPRIGPARSLEEESCPVPVVKANRSNNKKKKKKKKKDKKEVTQAEPTVPVMFKVPAEVGAHLCTSCRFTPQLCSCHVERIVRELVDLVSPLSPLSPSPGCSPVSETGGISESDNLGDIAVEGNLRSGDPPVAVFDTNEPVDAADELDVPEKINLPRGRKVPAQGERQISPEQPSAAFSLAVTDDQEGSSSVATLNGSDDVISVETTESYLVLSGHSDVSEDVWEPAEPTVSDTLYAGADVSKSEPCEIREVEDEASRDTRRLDDCSEKVETQDTSGNYEMDVGDSAPVMDPVEPSKEKTIKTSVVGRRRKSSDTSDTSIEDIEPPPRRTRKSTQKVLRSRTVNVAPSTALALKAKPTAKKIIAKSVGVTSSDGPKVKPPTKKMTAKSVRSSVGKNRRRNGPNSKEDVECEAESNEAAEVCLKRSLRSRKGSELKSDSEAMDFLEPAAETATIYVDGCRISNELTQYHGGQSSTEEKLETHANPAEGGNGELAGSSALPTLEPVKESMVSPHEELGEERMPFEEDAEKRQIVTKKKISGKPSKRKSPESKSSIYSSDLEPEEIKRPDDNASKPMDVEPEQVVSQPAEASSMDAKESTSVDISPETTTGGASEKGVTPAKPDLAGWMTLRNSLVEEASLLKAKRLSPPSKTPNGKRKQFDPAGVPAKAMKSAVVPSNVNSVPNSPLKPEKEDLSWELAEPVDGSKNDPALSVSPNLNAPSANRKSVINAPEVRDFHLEQSAIKASTVRQPSSNTNHQQFSSSNPLCEQSTSVSRAGGLTRPPGPVNLRSSLLSHIGQFFGNRATKLDGGPTEGTASEQNPKEFAHIPESANPDSSLSLPSSEARTDSEVESDQEMIIDYNSGSETPKSPVPGPSNWDSAPSGFGFYSQNKIPADSLSLETPSASKNSPTPEPPSFYSDVQAPQSPESVVDPTPRSPPIPQFSGFYSSEPAAAESVEPARKLVSFCADEKALCVPIPEEEIVACCINIVGFATHYCLPDGPLRTVPQLRELSADMKPKLSNAVNKYMLNSDGDNSLRYLKSFLFSKKILPSQLATELCDVLINSRSKVNPTKEEIQATGVPAFLSLTQKRAVLLICELGQGNHSFFDKVLTVMEQYLSTNPTELNLLPKKGANYGNVASVYAIICRSQGFILRAQSFIYDLLYGRHISYFLIILKIISIIPSTMPYAGPNIGPLTYTIAYLLMKQGIYKAFKEAEMQIYGVTQLRNRLHHKYGYSFPQDLTRDHVADELVKNIMTRGSDKAIVLLCKNQGFRYAHGVAQRYMFPFLKTVIDGEEQDEFKIARYIFVLGGMSRGFAVSICSPFVKTSLDLLEEILKQKPGLLVTESLVSALVHFQRLDLQRVTTILCHWTPPEGKVSLNCVKAVKRILAAKSPQYWKSLSHVS